MTTRGPALNQIAQLVRAVHASARRFVRRSPPIRPPRSAPAPAAAASTATSASPPVRALPTGRTIAKGGGGYKVGRPYRVAGRWYHPREDPDYDRVGTASWYGTAFHGRRTSNGEIYDMHALTAGHPTLPMPSYA